LGYWDTESTGQQEGVGEADNEPNEVVGLVTAEMQGKAAAQNMDTLDFDETWFTVEEGDTFNQTVTDDGYPILQTVDAQPQLKAQGIIPANFSVEIISPENDEEVPEDEALDVEINVVNTGGKKAKKTIELRDPVENKESVELERDKSSKITFTIPSDKVYDEFDIIAKSPDDTDQVTVIAVDTCFIATAAYGTATAEEIDILREFRDVVLDQNAVGRMLIKLYYSSSPPIARWIRPNNTRREVVKQYFVQPLVNIVNQYRNIWKQE